MVETTEMRLSASPTDVVEAIRKALPEEAIVRDENDAIGRFAAERTVMVVGRRERQLKLFRGTWRVVRDRQDRPNLEVELVDVDGELVARLHRAGPEVPGSGKRMLDVLANILTAAALVVAYYWFRKRPVDYAVVAGVGVGAGLLWSLVATLWPRREAAELDEMVRKALAPLAKHG